MPSSTFHLFADQKPYSVRIDRFGGSLDHYYHFIMDLAWPLHHWMEGRPGGWDRLSGLCTREERALYFAGHFEQMLGKRLGRMELLMRVLARCGLPHRVELIGFNSRVRDYLRTFPDLGAFRASRTSFVAQVARRAGSPSASSGMRTVALIERSPATDNRGALRRNIRHHEALASDIAGFCARRNTTFRNLRMEAMGSREQFLALRQGPTVLIGQHGAGLLNGLWMDAPGCAVIELAGEDSPSHFENLYTDLGTPYHRIVFTAEGTHGKHQTLLADPAPVIACLEQLPSFRTN